MADSYDALLNPERALIFRIIHRANLPWVLDHGLHCGNSATRAAQWVSIGNQELINKRAAWPVKVPPGGVLNNYVPFYFTPFSVMMRNINTGWNGVTQYPNSDILILVSSLRRVSAMGLPFLFTDSHANNNLAGYWSEFSELGRVDWKLLQDRDFKRDPDDPGKFGRYQAEALVHQHLPVQGLSGIVCYTEDVKMEIELALAQKGLNLQVVARKRWYFQ
jgi:hypothetical protein